ncbi:MAG: undecaprenyldiphospho-muramoylpentapeptide beta-N-acetylglucosaminyltransferase [Bacteroidales bacterium]|nr:undecaprenyldiphospho-muramoylpentapeptide beta-N-acetylglucosaminyltransferase [Bacteroidales bacterium]
MKKRFIISGGGTGGHIFPAIAIANRIKKVVPEAEILFIGASDKMEMRRVPDAGYKIEGLHIYGISRDLSLRGMLKNLKLPFVLLKANRRAKQIIRDFQPDVAVGVGGFASFAALNAANQLGVPTLIQEQNSYPGVTNKKLASRVRRICVAYDGLEKYFPAEKIVKTGNPVREEILRIEKKKPESFEFFGLSPEKKTLLVVGGSLGAKTINLTMSANIDKLKAMGIQVLWQTGESYYKQNQMELSMLQSDTIKIVPFIKNMNDAYGMADYIISRAGALAIAELSILGTPTILVPFPYAAEDHQTKNAMALVEKGAALIVKDSEAGEKLIPTLETLCADEQKCAEMSQNMAQFALPQAVDAIVDNILNL